MSTRYEVRRRWGLLAGVMLVPGLVACGAARPTQQLLDAREAYEHAEASPAPDFMPEAVIEARQALSAAERAHQEDAGSTREAHLAYIAERKAQIARAHGEGEAAMHAAKRWEQEHEARLQALATQRTTELESADDQLEDMRQRLEHIRGELDQRGAQLDARTQELQAREQELMLRLEQLEQERQARFAAEQGQHEAEMRTQQAFGQLDGVAQVQGNGEGTVITVPGQVMFHPGSWELKPTARQRLAKVAEALVEQAEHTTIMVVGHSDSTGDPDLNQRLSEARAHSVQQFLIERGVDPARIGYEGRGDAEPIEDNGTAAGRAMNRRVEIIVSDH